MIASSHHGSRHSLRRHDGLLRYERGKKLQSGRCTLVRPKDRLSRMTEIIAKILRSLANPRRIAKVGSSKRPVLVRSAIPRKSSQARRLCSIEATNERVRQKCEV